MINIVFGFLNLGLLLVLFAYYMKKSLIPALDLEIAEDESYINDLKKQHVVLQNMGEELTQHIAQQRLYIRDLQEKVRAWQEYVQHEQKQHITKRLQYLETIQEKKRIQADYALSMKMQRIARPSIVHKLEQELMAYYSEQKHGDQFTQAIVNYAQNIVPNDR